MIDFKDHKQEIASILDEDLSPQIREAIFRVFDGDQEGFILDPIDVIVQVKVGLTSIIQYGRRAGNEVSKAILELPELQGVSEDVLQELAAGYRQQMDAAARKIHELIEGALQNEASAPLNNSTWGQAAG